MPQFKSGWCLQKLKAVKTLKYQCFRRFLCFLSVLEVKYFTFSAVFDGTKTVLKICKIFNSFCHVIPYFEFFYIDDIICRDIEEFIKEMFNKKVKGHGSNTQTMKWNSVKKLYDALSALMTYAFNNDVIQKNPMKTVDFLPKNNFKRQK